MGRDKLLSGTMGFRTSTHRIHGEPSGIINMFLAFHSAFVATSQIRGRTFIPAHLTGTEMLSLFASTPSPQPRHNFASLVQSPSPYLGRVRASLPPVPCSALRREKVRRTLVLDKRESEARSFRTKEPLFVPFRDDEGLKRSLWPSVCHGDSNHIILRSTSQVHFWRRFRRVHITFSSWIYYRQGYIHLAHLHIVDCRPP